MTTQLKRQEARTYRARLEEMRANLLRAVSHDLRTPLTSISAAATLLSDDTEDIPPERRRAMLREISDDAQWLIRMVENLLSITRVGEAGGRAQDAGGRRGSYLRGRAQVPHALCPPCGLHIGCRRGW